MNPIDATLEILRNAGQRHYGEGDVTQFEHAVQCAMLAENEGASPALIVAALLHDIGHLVNPDDRAATQRREDCEHEQIGADYLSRAFGEAVTLPVRLHVAAKRYLTATDAGYRTTLSPASALSLELQGGPFSADLAAAFISLPYATDAVRLRRWDEGAKISGRPIPDLTHFRRHIGASLAVR